MNKLSNAQLWVHDQDEAVAFYTEKVGMRVREDVTLPELGDFRWVTVSPAGQPDVAIVLMAIPGEPVFDAETARSSATCWPRAPSARCSSPPTTCTPSTRRSRRAAWSSRARRSSSRGASTARSATRRATTSASPSAPRSRRRSRRPCASTARRGHSTARTASPTRLPTTTGTISKSARSSQLATHACSSVTSSHSITWKQRPRSAVTQLATNSSPRASGARPARTARRWDGRRPRNARSP